MATIDALLKHIKDEELRDQIAAEVRKLRGSKRFGLVYEDHLPENTALYGVDISVGALVARRDDIHRLMRVVRTDGGKALCQPEGGEAELIDMEDLVAMARIGEAIYPTLKPVDKISTAPDSELWHTLIEADNYHALQLLGYLYAGQVDCIYIDPPYNTGARDWKYNNDYVDSSDQYRHSKWLSMMERRLRLAKRLLRSADSVLICTIDEKEYLHLGCLLEQLFPEADIQMISNVIMPSGSSRAGRFSRADEYIFYCFFGSAVISRGSSDMLHSEEKTTKSVRWNGLIRNGEGSRRSRIPSLFYPILLDKDTGTFVGTGNPLPADMPKEDYKVPDGTIAMWPIDKSGQELMWRLYPPTFSEYYKKGYVKLGKRDKETGERSISYLQKGMIEKIQDGSIKVLGRDDEGCLQLEYAEGGKTYAPQSVWNQVSHSAAEHGSAILKKLIPNRKFAYPKSLYAVHDTIKFFVANKPNALIVDFFAGSGTTLHAVNLLNAEDGGERRCIMVTNNEVSDDEAKRLRARGFRPGDNEWERLGIARYVTWPRTVCSIKGRDINGNSLKGNYLGSDRPMGEGFAANVEYFKLAFLDKNAVALGAQLREVLPLLWMKAGARGERPRLGDGESIPKMLILPKNHLALLTDTRSLDAFTAAVRGERAIDTAFIVTDSKSVFERAQAELTTVPRVIQLYRDYLDNFRINENLK